MLAVLLLITAALCVEHKLADNEYLFLGTQLNETEIVMLIKHYQTQYVVKAIDERFDTFQQRVETFVRESLPIIRITRELLPEAFDRLATERDERTDNDSAQTARIAAKQSVESFATFRKLLSFDDDESEDNDVDTADRSEEAEGSANFIDEPDSSETYSSSEYSVTNFGNSLKAITRGGNGNHKHCDSGREVLQLSIDKFPDLSTMHPDFSLYVDEEQATVRFTVEVRYIPYDARYIFSFDSIEHASAVPLSCSSDFEGEGVTQKSKNLWGHAPNANYRDAFFSKQLYPAYYSSPESKWIPHAKGCSHVEYGATFSIEELTSCSDSDGRFAVGITKNAKAVTLFGVVWISLLQPSNLSLAPHNDTLQNAIVVAKWAHPFSLTIDQHDSKLILTDSANGGIRSTIKHQPTIARESLGARQRPRSVTLLRQASIIKDGFLELNLQTQFDSQHKHVCVARNLTLGHIGWTEFEIVETSSKGDAGAYCFNSKDPVNGQESYVVLQNWKLRSKQALQVYDGDFVLLFCDIDPQTDDTCDESNAIHRTTLGVRMSNSESPLEKTEEISFHNEITQHVSLVRDDNEPDQTELSSRVHTGSFESGQRACMQSYVIGPKKITSYIELKLIEAWLCTVEDQTSKDATQTSICPDGSHYIRLAWTEDNSTELFVNKAMNVTVYHPGSYGLLSVGVCFDANARFVDANNRSVIVKDQRYEAKVKMQPATVRRGGPMHIAPMYPVLEHLSLDKEREYDPAIQAVCAHAEDQSQQAGVFVTSKIRKSLDSAKAKGEDVTVQAHEFHVTPSDVDDPILSEFDNAVALVIMFFVVLLFAVLLYYCVVSASRMPLFATRASSRN